MENRIIANEVLEEMTALEIAGAGQRLVAWLADTLIGGMISVSVGFAMAVILAVLSGEPLVFVFAWIYACVIMFLVWQIVLLYMVSIQGQTFGKRLAKIRVVRTDGRRLGFIQAFLREILGKWVLFGIIVAVIGGIVWAFVMMLKSVFGLGLTDVEYLGWGFGLEIVAGALIVWMFMDKKNQGLHDKVVRTYVVKVQRVEATHRDMSVGMARVEVASAGERFMAWLIDTATAFGVVAVATLVIVWISNFINGMVLLIPFSVLIVVLYIVPYLWLVATRGQSPGKWATSIKIVRNGGRDLGLGGMLLREIVGKLISSIIILLGFIWILFDGQRQGWHDKIASTYVVKV